MKNEIAALRKHTLYIGNGLHGYLNVVLHDSGAGSCYYLSYCHKKNITISVGGEPT